MHVRARWQACELTVRTSAIAVAMGVWQASVADDRDWTR